MRECALLDCYGKHYCKGYCKMHYERVKRGRSVGPAERLIARKGEGKKNAQGYLRILVEGKRRPQHHLVMEKRLGRSLLPGETVHHKNGVRTDNRDDNLELWASRHSKGQRVEDLLDWAYEIIDTYEGTPYGTP